MVASENPTALPERYADLVLPRQWPAFIAQIASSLKSRDTLSGDLKEMAKDKFFAGHHSLHGGWQDPYKAPEALLSKHLMTIFKSPEDCDILLLDLWSHSHKSLRYKVNQQFDSAESDKVDFSEVAVLEDQISAVMGDNPSMDEDDVLLMTKIIYTERSLEFTTATDFAYRAPSATHLMKMAQDLQSSLSQHPANAKEWDDFIPAMADDINNLIASKKRRRKVIHTLVEKFGSFTDENADMLVFFGRTEWEWDTEALDAYGDVEAFQSLLAEINYDLAQYSKIQVTADNLEEEKGRRKKRTRLEDSILSGLNNLDSMIATSLELSKEANSRSLITPETIKPEETEKLDEFTVDPYEKIANLEAMVTALTSDKEMQAVETDDLRGQISESKNREFNWRQMYEMERKEKDSAAPEPITSIDSMSQAIDLAQERYKTKLTVRLNSKSDVKSNYYGDPREIWEALEWLATVYYANHSKTTAADLSLSLRNSCGWWYKPDQSEITMNQFPEWYETQVDGVKFKLDRHIGKGAIRHSNNTIRIAFDWDEENEKVIVGFIGRHQRTRKT